MKTIILLCMICSSSISVFAQNSKDNEREVYIQKLTYYGQFILDFVVVENDRIVGSSRFQINPSFWVGYKKKGPRKIVHSNVLEYVDCKVSYTDNGNIYIGTRYIKEFYTTENLNNYLFEMFKAHEGANFLNRLLHPKEAYLKACPDFFEITNEERLQYFLEHVEK